MGFVLPDEEGQGDEAVAGLLEYLWYGTGDRYLVVILARLDPWL